MPSYGVDLQRFTGELFSQERLAQQCDGVIGPCARHPSQLYEAGLEGLLLFIVLIYIALKGGFKSLGFLTGVFALGYGASRFFVEYFRVPDPQFFFQKLTLMDLLLNLVTMELRWVKSYHYL